MSQRKAMQSALVDMIRSLMERDGGDFGVGDRPGQKAEVINICIKT